MISFKLIEILNIIYYPIKFVFFSQKKQDDFSRLKYKTQQIHSHTFKSVIEKCGFRRNQTKKEKKCIHHTIIQLD